MTEPKVPVFQPGDRVRADARTGFPDGTVERVLDATYVLVRWDGDVLETADCRKLRKLSASSD